MSMQLVSTIPDGYYALAVSILKGVNPDDAIELFDGGQEALRKVDTAQLAELKKTMTYKQIGQMYGLKADAVYNRIRRYKGKIT